MKKTSLYILITLIIISMVAVWRSTKKGGPSPAVDTIIVGTNAEFQPFAFKEGNTITGFDIDVITEVFKRLDKKFVIKDMPFDALIPEIQLGNIHVIAGGITPTKERAKRALFTEPHITGDSLAIISLKTGPAINSIHDLYDKTIVVNEGYTADTYVSHLEQKNEMKILRLSSSSVSDGILALQSDRADAFVTALRPVHPCFDLHGKDKFNIMPIQDTEESSAFAISKHYPDLKDTVQITLDRMQADGTLDALKKKWGLS